MALRGNLRDFSLPDVFQLVTLSGKTGVLRIKRADAEGSVWFREGNVFFAQSDWHREPLGTRLVTGGRITPSALAKALDLQRIEPPGGRRLGQILVDEGYTTDKVLESFVQEQIQDTIFDLFRWDEGDFDFEDLAEAPEEDIGLSVSIENIVMEGSRRLEEWTRIKKKIPSMGVVFKMATAPGEGTFDISLKPAEWNILLRIDGTRAVSDLARELDRTDFEVARVLYGLFSAGLLEVASEAEVQRLRAERAATEMVIAADGLRRAQEAAVQVTAPPAATGASAPREGAPDRVAEEPAFLSAGQGAATVDDMAVFQQMLGAVLDPSTAVQATPATTPRAPVPSVEPRLESQTPPGVSSASAWTAPPADVPASFAPPAAPGLDLAGLLETLEHTAVESPAGYPRASEPASVIPPAEVPGSAPERTGDFAVDLMALGLGEAPAAPSDAQPEPTIAEIEAAALAGSTPGEAAATGEAPDAVISTDAFLSEFDAGDVSFSSGLGDELTALTGGGHSRARPTASISKSPESSIEGASLHRDMHVDRELMMKIIEGVRHL